MCAYVKGTGYRDVFIVRMIEIMIGLLVFFIGLLGIGKSIKGVPKPSVVIDCSSLGQNGEGRPFEGRSHVQGPVPREFPVSPGLGVGATRDKRPASFDSIVSPMENRGSGEGFKIKPADGRPKQDFPFDGRR